MRSYLTFRNGLAITDTSLLNHVEGLHRVLIQNITRHFNTTYNMTLSETVVAEKLLVKLINTGRFAIGFIMAKKAIKVMAN